MVLVSFSIAAPPPPITYVMFGFSYSTFDHLHKNETLLLFYALNKFMQQCDIFSLYSNKNSFQNSIYINIYPNRFMQNEI